jgi:hypothetical protein
MRMIKKHILADPQGYGSISSGLFFYEKVPHRGQGDSSLSVYCLLDILQSNQLVAKIIFEDLAVKLGDLFSSRIPDVVPVNLAEQRTVPRSNGLPVNLSHLLTRVLPQGFAIENKICHRFALLDRAFGLHRHDSTNCPAAHSPNSQQSLDPTDHSRSPGISRRRLLCQSIPHLGVVKETHQYPAELLQEQLVEPFICLFQLQDGDITGFVSKPEVETPTKTANTHDTDLFFWKMIIAATAAEKRIN